MSTPGSTARRAALAALQVQLYDFARGSGEPDDIPARVRGILAVFPLGHAEALGAMNTEACAIRDGHFLHGPECSQTIREDDRASLFANVAGWMLSHGTAGLTDPQIVDAAITDSYGTAAGTVRGWSA